MNLQFESPFEPQQRSPHAQSITAQAPINEQWVLREAGGGEVLFAKRAAVTPRVPAGDGVVDVSVTMQNAAISVAPSDPDSCSLGILRSGFEYEVEVNPSWAPKETTTNCLKTRSQQTHEFSIPAPPTAGEEEVEITLRGTGSGKTAGGPPFSVSVVGENNDDDISVRPGPGEGRGNEGDGTGLVPGTDIGGFTTGLVGGLVLLVVLLLLLVAVGGG